jgi:hypothetical protein
MMMYLYSKGRPVREMDLVSSLGDSYNHRTIQRLLPCLVLPGYRASRISQKVLVCFSSPSKLHIIQSLSVS